MGVNTVLFAINNNCNYTMSMLKTIVIESSEISAESFVKRVFEKSLMVYQIFLDPPKSPLKTLTLVPPLTRGVRGDL
jgi:hypothetical protein